MHGRAALILRYPTQACTTLSALSSRILNLAEANKMLNSAADEKEEEN